MLHINPEFSQLGLVRESHETFNNERGVLNVMFRYDQDALRRYTHGFQVQFETIDFRRFRGSHYHSPESAVESFYVLRGHGVLLMCDLRRSTWEMYSLLRGITYTVPGLIAHKAFNVSHLLESRDTLELVVAKPFNYKIANFTDMLDMESEAVDTQLALCVSLHRTKATNE